MTSLCHLPFRKHYMSSIWGSSAWQNKECHFPFVNTCSVTKTFYFPEDWVSLISLLSFCSRPKLKFQLCVHYKEQWVVSLRIYLGQASENRAYGIFLLFNIIFTISTINPYWSSSVRTFFAHTHRFQPSLHSLILQNHIHVISICLSNKKDRWYFNSADLKVDQVRKQQVVSGSVLNFSRDHREIVRWVKILSPMQTILWFSCKGFLGPTTVKQVWLTHLWNLQMSSVV